MVKPDPEKVPGDEDPKPPVEPDPGQETPPELEPENGNEEAGGFEAVIKGIKDSRFAVAGGDVKVNQLGDKNTTYNFFDSDAATAFFRQAEQEAEELRRLQQRERVSQLNKDGPFDDQTFNEWFADIAQAEMYYFIIVAALFEGIDWSIFLEIHRRVLERVGFDSDEDQHRQIDSFSFNLTDEELTQQTFVKRVPIIEQGKYGDVRSNVVQLSREGLRERILDSARDGHSIQMMKISPVILDYGRHEVLAIRSKAAYAAAELAFIDFNTVWHNVILEWASDNRRFIRAVVCHFAEYLLERQMLVGNLLSGLSELANNSKWQYQWAAASAYKNVSMYRPDVTFEELDRLVKYEHSAVRQAITFTMTWMFERGLTEDVITTLARWARLADRVQDRTDAEINLNTLAVLTLYLIGLNDFESSRYQDDSQNLFTLLAASLTSPITTNTAAILMPTSHEPAGFAFNFLRAWSMSKTPHAAQAVGHVVLAIHALSDERRQKAVVNFMNRWANATRVPELQAVATIVQPNL